MTAPGADAVTVLGVDPGSYATGWGLIRATQGRPALIDCGLIRLPRRESFARRLHDLHKELSEIAARHVPTVACVEAPFHGVNPRSALQLAHARGVVLAALAGAGIPVEEVPPATVKRVVAGSGRAGKQQVQTMIRTILATDRPWDSEDVSDALAVAYCWAVHRAHADGLRRAGIPEGPLSDVRSVRRRRRGPAVRRAR